jgi:tetratricopeptide (TPR) repeat protein
MKIWRVGIALLIGCNATSSEAAPSPQAGGVASLDKAEMLASNGLTQDATRELIEVIFSGDSKSKPAAYYKLGSLAFREGRPRAAVAAWTDLVRKYPQAPEALSVKERLKQLAEVVLDPSKSTPDDAVAQAYLNHGNFWSNDKSAKYFIDSSYLPVVEIAVAWYDRVIKEFPKSSASRQAHEEKIKTLLGWSEHGQYAEKYGAQKDPAVYMPQVEAALAALETEDSDAPALQALRFQIAQEYWRERKGDLANRWLNRIVEKAGDTPSFYKDLAQQRLAKLQH